MNAWVFLSCMPHRLKSKSLRAIGASVAFCSAYQSTQLATITAEDHLSQHARRSASVSRSHVPLLILDAMCDVGQVRAANRHGRKSERKLRRNQRQTSCLARYLCCKSRKGPDPTSRAIKEASRNGRKQQRELKKNLRQGKKDRKKNRNDPDKSWSTKSATKRGREVEKETAATLKEADTRILV